jgi:hypothetical protein
LSSAMHAALVIWDRLAATWAGRVEERWVSAGITAPSPSSDLVPCYEASYLGPSMQTS